MATAAPPVNVAVYGRSSVAAAAPGRGVTESSAQTVRRRWPVVHEDCLARVLARDALPIHHLLFRLYFDHGAARDGLVADRELEAARAVLAAEPVALLIKDDYRKMDMIYDENYVISAGIAFKKHVKDSIRITAFNELLEMQKEHLVNLKFFCLKIIDHCYNFFCRKLIS